MRDNSKCTEPSVVSIEDYKDLERRYHNLFKRYRRETKRKTRPDLFNVYVNHLNEIDDYFEYRCESKRDQSYVHTILNKLTIKVSDILKR